MFDDVKEKMRLREMVLSFLVRSSGLVSVLQSMVSIGTTAFGTSEFVSTIQIDVFVRISMQYRYT